MEHLPADAPPRSSGAPPEPRRPAVWLLVGLGTAAVLEATLIRIHAGLPVDVIIEGFGFLAAGIALWLRHPESRIGKLLTLYPFLIWLIQLQKTDVPLLWTIGPPLFTLSGFGIVVYVLLTYPRGRVTSRVERTLFILVLGNIAWLIAIQFFYEPSLIGCSPTFPRPECPEGLNLLLIRHDPAVVEFMARVTPWFLAAAMLPAAALLVAKFARASGPGRRVLLPVLLPGLVILVVNRVTGLILTVVQPDPLGPEPPILKMLATIDQAAVVVFPYAVLLGLWGVRARRARVADMVMELSPQHAEEQAAAPLEVNRVRRLRPWLAAVMGAVLVAWGIQHARIVDRPEALQDAWTWAFVVAGWMFVVAGMIAWARRPENRSGRLMVLCGFLFFLQSTLPAVLLPVPWTIALFTQSLFVIVLFYLMLAFPHGRLASNVDRALMVMVIGSVALEIVANLFFEPRAAGCLPCPEHLNLLLIRSDPSLANTLHVIVHTYVAVGALLLAARLAFRLWSSTGPARLVLGPLYLSTAVWVLGHSFFRVTLVLNLGTAVRGLRGDQIDAFQLGSNTLLATIPFAFLFGILRSEARRARVADLVQDLGSEERGPVEPDAPKPRRALLVTMAVAAVAWIAAIATRSREDDALYWFSFLVPGLGFVVAGAAAWWRRPDNRMGKLMVLAGFAFFVATLVGTRHPVLWTIGSALGNLAVVLVIYAILAFPRGRLWSRLDHALLAVYAVLFVALFIPLVWYSPRDLGCTNCSEELNLLLVRSDPDLFLRWNRNTAPFIVAAGVAVITVLIVRWVRASSPQRRVLWPMAVPGVAFVLAQAFQVVVLTWIPLSVPYTLGPLRYTMAAGLTLLPLTLLFGLTRERARRTRVADLVRDLTTEQAPVGDMVVELTDIKEEPVPEPVPAAAPRPERVRDALARTLGDPSLEVGYWDRESSRYVTVEGRLIEIPEDTTTRAATFLERRGEPLAVILHDPALLEDRRMLDAAAAAARLAIENERLQAEVRAQLEEVRASRARIVAAGDEERKRVERNLHDGAQQRLLTLSLQLRMIEERLGEQADPSLRALVDKAEAEAGSALDELRELAQGVHPAILTDEGLGPAIEFLAERSAVPVDVEVAGGRYPEQVEATAYFVVAEALANVAKYAQASRVTVQIASDDGKLRVQVSDDGIGGADASRGSGLRGLQDRVAAIGGRLEITSAPGSGTSVIATLAVR